MSEPTEAGRALDCLVAERVLGWKPLPGPSPQMGAWFQQDYWAKYGTEQRITPDDSLIPNYQRAVYYYSTQLADAWEVVTKLRDTTEGAETFWTFTDCGALGWRADISENVNPSDALYEAATATANTLPLAICRAALLCVGRGTTGGTDDQ